MAYESTPDRQATVRTDTPYRHNMTDEKKDNPPINSGDPLTRETKSRPSLKNVVGSILAAGFGVQSSSNRERDFQQGNFKVFLIGGIIFTLLFIATIAAIVSLVLS